MFRNCYVFSRRYVGMNRTARVITAAVKRIYREVRYRIHACKGNSRIIVTRNNSNKRGSIIIPRRIDSKVFYVTVIKRDVYFIFITYYTDKCADTPISADFGIGNRNVIKCKLGICLSNENAFKLITARNGRFNRLYVRLVVYGNFLTVDCHRFSVDCKRGVFRAVRDYLIRCFVGVIGFNSPYTTEISVYGITRGG